MPQVRDIQPFPAEPEGSDLITGLGLPLQSSEISGDPVPESPSRGSRTLPVPTGAVLPPASLAAAKRSARPQRPSLSGPGPRPRARAPAQGPELRAPPVTLAHLVVRQLQGQLHERVRAGTALLYQLLPESVKRERMEVHVVGQEVRAAQGRLDHLLTLEDEEKTTNSTFSRGAG